MNGALESRTELLWRPLVDGGGLALAALAMLALLVLSFLGSRGLPADRRAALMLLRALAYAGLALFLAGPRYVHSTGRALREPLVVMIDSSRSMRVEDAGGSRAARVAAWIDEHGDAWDELARDHELRWFLVDESLRPWAPGQPAAQALPMPPPGDTPVRILPGAAVAGGDAGGSANGATPPAEAPSPAGIPADGAGSDLGAGLFALREALAGVRPAGVLLVSDGADRAALSRSMADGGAAAVESLVRELGFPVSAWPVGDPAGPRDLAIRAVHAPPFGFVRREFEVDVDLERRGLAASPWLLTLRRDGEAIGSAEPAWAPDGTARVSFPLTPDEVGYHTYEVALPVPAGDTLPANNVMEFTVKVLRDRTRILQVTSRPSWDVKFLRRLLKSDPNIDLVSFFILRTHDRVGELIRSDEDLSLIPFPYDELFTKDLVGFDLVIFQNFWFQSFSPLPDEAFLGHVADYVEQGGAFLMLGGDLSFGSADYGNSPLARVLPTLMPGQAPSTASYFAVPTEAGLRHPVTRLERDAPANAARWAALPILQGSNPLGALQPGAVALLTAGEAGAPILAVRGAGKGRTLAFANDTSWRWALAGRSGPGAGQDHALFWRNAVRWLVRDAEQQQVQVVTDKENYELGEPVRVQVRVLTEDYSPLADSALRLSLRRVAGGAGTGGESVIEGRTDASGILARDLPIVGEGTWLLQADVHALPPPFGSAEARVSVSDRRGELEDPRVRADLLAAVARGTGGVLLEGSSPDPRGMVRRAKKELLSLDRRSEPAFSWPLLLLLLLPLGGEWILRRRFGLH